MWSLTQKSIDNQKKFNEEFLTDDGSSKSNNFRFEKISQLLQAYLNYQPPRIKNFKKKQNKRKYLKKKYLNFLKKKY